MRRPQTHRVILNLHVSRVQPTCRSQQDTSSNLCLHFELKDGTLSSISVNVGRRQAQSKRHVTHFIINASGGGSWPAMDGLQSLRRHISSGGEGGVDSGTYKTSAGITSHNFNKPEGFFLFFLVDLSPGEMPQQFTERTVQGRQR